MNNKNFTENKDFFVSRKGFLFEQEVVINNSCDENCLFCSIDVKAKDNQRIFSFHLPEIIDKLTMQKKISDSIKITGGEPTLHPKLPEIIKHAREIGFRDICIETNGQNFSDEAFAKKIVEAGANRFFISIHGQKAALHEKITRTKKSFQKTVEGTKNLIKIGAFVNSHVVINKINYKHIADTVKFLADLGVPLITLSFITISGAVLKNKGIIPRIGDVVKYTRKITEEYFSRVILQHIPFCFLGELNRVNGWIKYEDKKVLYTPSYKITFERLTDSFGYKSKKCSSCRFDNICYGLDNGYYELFGSGEIKTQSGKKFKDFEDYKKYGSRRYQEAIR
jgi:MoaA/NifB/PqqE/SkfB family radical SAM enzyme